MDARTFDYLQNSKAVEAVLRERVRQAEVEGFDSSHDDRQHAEGQLAKAAACYAYSGSRDGGNDFLNLTIGSIWPWHELWWKPKNRRSDLVRAGALILAEIDRLDRANAKVA